MEGLAVAARFKRDNFFATIKRAASRVWSNQGVNDLDRSVGTEIIRQLIAILRYSTHGLVTAPTGYRGQLSQNPFFLLESV